MDAELNIGNDGVCLLGLLVIVVETIEMLDHVRKKVTAAILAVGILLEIVQLLVAEEKYCKEDIAKVRIFCFFQLGLVLS